MAISNDDCVNAISTHPAYHLLQEIFYVNDLLHLDCCFLAFPGEKRLPFATVNKLYNLERLGYLLGLRIPNPSMLQESCEYKLDDTVST